VFVYRVITKDLLSTFNIRTVAVPKVDGRQQALKKLWARKNFGIEATGEEKAFLDDPYIACKRAGVAVTAIRMLLTPLSPLLVHCIMLTLSDCIIV
jgi:hypothetical protein